jgi:predicted O-methyltransferase YrrM
VESLADYIHENIEGWMHLDELLWLGKQAKQLKPLVWVEVGVWLGKSAKMVANCLPEGSNLYLVDTWEGSPEDIDRGDMGTFKYTSEEAFEIFKDNFNNELLPEYHVNICLLKTDSVSASRMFAPESVDVVFIDASHTYESVCEDITFWFPSVKTGGLICGHDYYIDGSSCPGVKQAVDEFTMDIKDQLYFPTGTIWCYRK